MICARCGSVRQPSMGGRAGLLRAQRRPADARLQELAVGKTELLPELEKGRPRGIDPGLGGLPVVGAGVEVDSAPEQGAVGPVARIDRTHRAPRQRRARPRSGRSGTAGRRHRSGRRVVAGRPRAATRRSAPGARGRPGHRRARSPCGRPDAGEPRPDGRARRDADRSRRARCGCGVPARGGSRRSRPARRARPCPSSQLGEPLVQLGPRLLGQGVVRGVADQEVTEAEGLVLAGASTAPAGSAPCERATARFAWDLRARIGSSASISHRGAVEHLPLDGAAADDLALPG